MAMLESEIASDSANNYGAGLTGAANGVDTHLGHNGSAVGTQGLFAAIEERGNITTGVTGAVSYTHLTLPTILRV